MLRSAPGALGGVRKKFRGPRVTAMSSMESLGKPRSEPKIALPASGVSAVWWLVL
jgi:hypothetical protein